MEPGLILETTFLIDFERQRRSRSGDTLDFLTAHREKKLFITHTIAGELASGKTLSGKEDWEDFISPFHILEWTTRIDWEYGNAFRYLMSQGLLIGANDLWIAATALAYGYPLVSANEEHFSRVPNLQVMNYRRGV